MFIAYTNSEIKYVEGKDNLTWDDIPHMTVITSLSLTFPFAVNMNGEEINPKINISKYDAYFFYNEAVVAAISSGHGVQMDPVLQAKVIAGIDFTTNIVLEIRVDKWGNVSTTTYPLQDLKDLIAKGQFRETTLRYGPVGKQML